jgi:hypothetical protein
MAKSKEANNKPEEVKKKRVRKYPESVRKKAISLAHEGKSLTEIEEELKGPKIKALRRWFRKENLSVKKN